MRLSELKSKSAEELGTMWFEGQFPFDFIESCHKCVTIHGTGCGEHPQFRCRAAAII
jgi:hypothetical protein